MAISKQRKIELVAQYVEQLKQSKGAILADYRGLSVSEMSEIRQEIRPIGGELQVVKNRLLLLALKEVGVSLPDDWLIGPTTIGFCNNEVPPVAKALMGATKNTALHIKGGVMDASVVSAEQVRAIAALPSREVLLAQVLGSINAPARQTAGVIASGVRQMLNVLQAYVDKLQESGSAPIAGPEQAAEPA